MRLTIPLTGTVVLNPDRQTWQSGSDVGVAVDIGDIAWRAVSFDWENGTVEVEVVDVPRRNMVSWQGLASPICESNLTPAQCDAINDGTAKNVKYVPETDAQYNTRKAAVLASAQTLLNRPMEELYSMSGLPPLKVQQATSDVREVM